ncbi:MAG: histidine ammonia-lyase [Bacteroidota bacterium]
MSTHKIDPDKVLDFETIGEIVREGRKLALSGTARKKIERCREYLDKKLKNIREPIYGINTGFGSLHNTTIAEKDLEKLQENLIRSHACGTGPEVPREIVKLMLLLKIRSLSYGYSGVQTETVEALIALFNNDVLPVVYEQGSLGASGDLAPLAHLCLPLIGEGEVNYEGQKVPAAAALKKIKLRPLKFRSKEALALLNGTQFMGAYAVWCVMQAQQLLISANKIAALSLDAFDGRIDPFDVLIHSVRAHIGQLFVAQEIRDHLEGSAIISRKKQHVQDPYSFRCVPQVHGASWSAIDYALKTILMEVNSVTDNPTVFPEADRIISGGNFHGQPLALTLDFLAIAIAELASISERRTYLLISGQRGLPPFLVAEPGLNSGFMIPQYTAASIVSRNKQLCTPASVDSIVSSNGQEDHVSMGANAAVKCMDVIENTQRVLAIELFTAAQALEFRRPLRSSAVLEKMISAYRKQVAFIKSDEIMYTAIEKSISFLTKGL